MKKLLLIIWCVFVPITPAYADDAREIVLQKLDSGYKTLKRKYKDDPEKLSAINTIYKTERKKISKAAGGTAIKLGQAARKKLRNAVK